MAALAKDKRRRKAAADCRKASKRRRKHLRCKPKPRPARRPATKPAGTAPPSKRTPSTGVPTPPSSGILPAAAPAAPQLTPPPTASLPTVPVVMAPVGTEPAPIPPAPAPPATDLPGSLPRYRGSFGIEQAERLLWRAGFGPRPGDGARVAALGLEAAVLSLTRPVGDPRLVGREPYSPDGTWTLSPTRSRGHDHLFWMDRMLRSDQPLVERLALVFHDWFATNMDGVGSQQYMLDQTNTFRTHGLGSFRELVVAITQDPAMIQFLNLNTSSRQHGINENYARELMELFTLGADRGAYSEQDVREMARALSGCRNDWADTGGYNFRWEPDWSDPGTKSIFGQTGTFDWADACRLVIDHPLHASFFVQKLWSYFVADPIPERTATALAELYVASDHQIRPVLEAILLHPLFYAGGSMIKPPVVAIVGMMRAREQAITREWWWWVCANAGQWLYHPPDVAGWRDDAWLDTSTMRYRFEAVHYVLEGETIDPNSRTYPADTPSQAVQKAVDFWCGARLSNQMRATLEAWVARVMPIDAGSAVHAQCQNALRHLIGVSPDYSTC